MKIKKMKINKQLIILFIIYLVSLLTDYFFKITNLINEVEIVKQIASNKLNIIIILLPVLAIIITFYFSDLKKVISDYGFNLTKDIIPKEQHTVIIDIIFFIFMSILVALVDVILLAIIYIIHSIIIAFKIIRSIKELNGDVVVKYIDKRQDEIIEIINSNSIKINTSDIYTIGIKSICHNQDYITFKALTSLNKFISEILEHRNTLLDSNLDRDDINETLKREYKQMMKICSLIDKSELIQAGSPLHYILSKPLISCFKYENLSSYKVLSHALQQKFVVSKYIEEGCLGNSSVVDIFEIALNDILENRISPEWLEEIIDNVEALVLFDTLSSKSSLNNSIGVMVNRFLLSEASKDSTVFQDFLSLFFKFVRTSLSKNSEYKFNYIIINSIIQEMFNESLEDLVIEYFDEFDEFNKYCLANKYENTYYENYLVYNMFYKQADNYPRIYEKLHEKLDSLMFVNGRLLNDHNIEIEYANLYIKTSFKNLSGLECLDSYKKLFASALKKDNVNLLHLLLDRINDEIAKIKIENADDQCKFFDVYKEILRRVILKSDMTYFGLIFTHYMEIIQKLDNDKNISKRVFGHILDDLKETAHRCLETNNTEMCNIITNDLHDSLINFKVVSSFDERKLVVESLSEIGVRAIEYENIIIIKSVSNSLGWICKKNGLDDRSKDIVKLIVIQLVLLYNLTTTVLDSPSTTIFIGTAFIILGGITESDKAFVPYNKVILAELKKLKKASYLSSSYALRHHHSNNWKGSFSSPAENLKKFYVKLSSELSIS